MPSEPTSPPPVLTDRLRELGNIGCGHALTALSKMIDADLNIRVPEIKWMEYSRVPGRLGDAQSETVSVMLDIWGEVDGVFLLLLKPEIATAILSAMDVKASMFEHVFTERQRSALMELGNILCSAYMTAVSQMTGFEVRISVPALAIDMLEAVLNLPIIRFAQAEDRMLYIQNIFTIAGQDWAGSMLFLPRLDSAQMLSDRLNGWL